MKDFENFELFKNIEDFLNFKDFEDIKDSEGFMYFKDYGLRIWGILRFLRVSRIFRIF